MSLDALREALPAYAKDLSLNLSSLAGETLLNDQQKWGTFVASAHAVGVPQVVKAIEAAAREAGLSEEAFAAAKAAAAIMAMNNVYYRALHLMENAGKVLSREQLLSRVWGYDFGYGSNSLDVYISYLRKKTETGGKPRLIHTVRGVGYALREP